MESFGIQKEYDFQGLTICVETPTGALRHWHDPHSGESGSTKMLYDYGYIKDSKNIDGDEVDVYVGPNKSSNLVFVVLQMKKPNFDLIDENKVMIGFSNKEDAVKAYLAHYNDPRFLGDVYEMTMDEFKPKLNSLHGYLIKSKLNNILKFDKLHTNMEKSMPFKSDAQRKYMFAAEGRGEIPKGTAEEFADATPKGKGLPKHVKEKKKDMKKSAIDTLKAMNEKLDEEFLKGCDPVDHEEDADDMDKALKSSVVNSLARRLRAEEAFMQSTNPDAYKAGIAQPQPAMGIFRMTPAGEPPVVPVRRIEAPPEEQRAATMYKSCTACGTLSKSINGEDADCRRCASLQEQSRTTPDFWRR